jgi:hypothetical protein
MDFDELTDRQRDLIHAGIDAKTTGWPKELREEDPGRDDPEERLDWYEEQQKVAEGVEKVMASEEEEGEEEEEANEKEAEEGETEEEKGEEALSAKRTHRAGPTYSV